MKLRYIYIIVLCILTSGCNYLDIMPDERAKLEDSYNTPSKTEGFLYSCYTYMPMNRTSQDSQPYQSWYPTALLTGGEVTTYYKANEPEQLFTMGLYNPTNNSIVSHRWWPDMERGPANAMNFWIFWIKPKFILKPIGKYIEQKLSF